MANIRRSLTVEQARNDRPAGNVSTRSDKPHA
jgi:hypothetical protein